MYSNRFQVTALATASLFLASVTFATTVNYSGNNADTGGGSQSVTVTTIAGSSAGTSTASSGGMQESAKSGSGAQQTGTMVSGLALGVCAIGAASACSSEQPSCGWWIAGGVASGVAMVAMMVAQGQSDESDDAVSVNKKRTGATDPVKKAKEDPNYKKWQSTMAKLEKKGYKFDGKNSWYDPNKKKWLKTDDFKSPSSMAAAGFSSKDIGEYQATMAKINKDVQDKLKGADGSSPGGDDGIAGGKGAAPSAAAGEVSSGSDPTGLSGPSLNRDPAQVAGMARSYGDEMIGVSGDSLFSMMNRRYKLHSDRGHFINGQLTTPGPVPKK